MDATDISVAGGHHIQQRQQHQQHHQYQRQTESIESSVLPADKQQQRDETLLLSILEELDLKFGAAKNKAQIIYALEHSNVLHRIPCATMSPAIVTTEQAKKDFKRERVLLNDVPFIPDRFDVDRCHAFSITLQMLLQRLLRQAAHCSRCGVEEVTDLIMQRACRTSAGADSFFTVQKMLCVEGTFVTQRAFLNDPPVKLDVFFATETYDEGEQEAIDSTSNNYNNNNNNNSNNYNDSSNSNSNSNNSSTLDVCASVGDAASPANSTGATGDAVDLKDAAHSGAGRRGIAMEADPAPPTLTSAAAAAPIAAAASVATATQTAANITTAQLQHGANRGTPPTKRLLFGHPHPLYKKAQAQDAGSSRNWTHGTHGSRDSSNTSQSQTTTLMSPSSQRQQHPQQQHLQQQHLQQQHLQLPQPQRQLPRRDERSLLSLCARSQVINSFAVYDVSAIEEVTGVAADDPAPWLEVEAIVFDESNFKSGKHWRKLQLIVTCPETGQVYTSSSSTASGAAANYRSSGRLSGRMILQELSSWFHCSHSVNSSSSGSMWLRHTTVSSPQLQLREQRRLAKEEGSLHMHSGDMQQQSVLASDSNPDDDSVFGRSSLTPDRSGKEKVQSAQGKLGKVLGLTGIRRRDKQQGRDLPRGDSLDHDSSHAAFSDCNTSQSSELPPATGPSTGSSAACSAEAGASSSTSTSRRDAGRGGEDDSGAAAAPRSHSTTLLLDSDDDDDCLAQCEKGDA